MLTVVIIRSIGDEVVFHNSIMNNVHCLAASINQSINQYFFIRALTTQRRFTIYTNINIHYIQGYSIKLLITEC